MSTTLISPCLIAFAVLFANASAARSDEWVSCKRDQSTGELLWMRGKSTQPLGNTAFRPTPSNPDLGTCLVGHEQPSKAHGLKF